MFINEGVIDKLYLHNVDSGKDNFIENNGVINAIKEITNFAMNAITKNSLISDIYSDF